ncbi:MAG TPA: ribonucleoprotein [Candidatus Bathyarchaeota archaeon]|nr:ribonucleoprotein [Candidatus Bathyarchaeota archaeon]
MRGVSMEANRRPLNMLTRFLNSPIVIKLKNGVEYHGIMEQCDGYMNVVLSQAKEFVKGQPTVNYGTNIFIRGNNILYVVLEPPK